MNKALAQNKESVKCLMVKTECKYDDQVGNVVMTFIERICLCIVIEKNK